MEKTFPIDSRELARRRRSSVFGSLLTWLVPMPAFFAWTFMGLNTFAFLGLMIAAGVGLFYYWKKTLPKLERQWIEELTDKSNDQQNQLLEKRAQEFNAQQGKTQAKVLREALTLKAEIETRVHRSSLGQEKKEKIDTLVDTIAFALVGKLESWNGKPSEEQSEEVAQALQVLRETKDDLPKILDPSHELDVFKPEDPLLEAMGGLKEEIRLADSVKQRLQTDWDIEHREKSVTTYAQVSASRSND